MKCALIALRHFAKIGGMNNYLNFVLAVIALIVITKLQCMIL